MLNKGTGPETDGYSGFDGTDLAAVLREHGVDRLTIVGLATDYCVRATALDARREGFAVTGDRAGVRGIDVHPGDIDAAFAEIESAGGTVI